MLVSLPPKRRAAADQMPGRRWITLVPFRCRCQNHRPCCQSSACASQLLFRDWFVVSTLKTTITVSLRLPRKRFRGSFFGLRRSRENPWFRGGCVTHSMAVTYVGGIGIVYAAEAVGSPWLNSSPGPDDRPLWR